jgi:hypothetical protein
MRASRSSPAASAEQQDARFERDDRHDVKVFRPGYANATIIAAIASMITPPYLLRSLLFWLLLLPGKDILVHTSLDGGGANATLTGSTRNRMLSLNGFLLRSDATSANAWTDSASEDVEIFSWEKGRLAAQFRSTCAIPVGVCHHALL